MPRRRDDTDRVGLNSTVCPALSVATHCVAVGQERPPGGPTTSQTLDGFTFDPGSKVALAPIGNWVMENQTDIEEARERIREQSPEDSAVIDD